MERAFRLFDFTIYNEKGSSTGDTSSEDETSYKKEDNTKFQIQMFGINEHGQTCSILVEDFKPFFYVKVDDFWNIQIKNLFLEDIKKKIGKYYENCISECKLIKRKKLYGFDGNREHKFIVFQFENMQAFNKAKNLWYDKSRKLLKNGYIFRNTKTYLYEANIPPLLRFFHIKDISPSGWIALPNKKTTEFKNDRKTTCTYEFSISYKDIIPLNNKETRVPYKICSFDIEASSSHGDFPVPIKSYKKLATNIVEYFESLKGELSGEQCRAILKKCVLSAFGFGDSMVEIDLVYPKNPPKNKDECENLVEKWLKTNIRTLDKSSTTNEVTIETMFEKMNQTGDDEDSNLGFSTKYVPSSKKDSVVDLMLDHKFERNAKILEINVSLNSIFPKLEGDKVTFIGSTFVKYGDPEPYYNHCAVLNSCEQLETANSKMDSYSTEKEVLLAWTKLIQTENPDIIIGYNIFGFDYEFMFRRAEENGCLESFLNLSKNRGEICASKDFDTGKYKMEESTLQIASGQHDLKYIKMNGRIQIDMYNFFRREENLTSYKLDYVAGYFIGDYVKKLEHRNGNTVIYTTNLTGLLVGSYVHFEEIGHSVDYYKEGEKFKVAAVNKTDGQFEIIGEVSPDMGKKVRWCLAKDDVTPKDIFRLANGDARDRAVVAKYCIQDCNLVHYLMRKVDVFTGFIEMAKICSVPINFLILRGQGIKLTSYVAKKCREKNTLMPVIEKLDEDDGYEGAIVLDPKCDLYLDNPVACVDYASLYPSSMMSENLSHDSKVWTKEYDLDGNLVAETGEKDQETGEFIYDNLPDYEYVNITYDTFKYVRKTPSSSAEKIKSGYKICRFAQFPNGTRAIMPSILEELLTARKTTRKLIPLEQDDFMKNVLDKRQLGYKVTANSLYGQCGARTSTFYEKDIAASTTATGRLLLTYAKKVIEECYGDSMCQTANYGPVLTKAEYIYGDSVASYTPVYLRVNNILDICSIEGISEKYGNNKWVSCLEQGKQEKEVCELNGLVETWTEKGWTKLHRVIRHKLASHKKMVQVITNSGMVVCTDDHSLLLENGEEVSPKDVTPGINLLHSELPAVDEKILASKLILDSTIKNGTINFNIDAQCYAALVNIIALQRGFYTTITQTNTEYTLKIHEKKFSKNDNPNAIKKMTEIQYEGYVYDLTTENHHFAAGIGNMIVHNTDSVFFTFNLQNPDGTPIRGKKALDITIELAQEAGHLASKFLKGPHDLEYEKTFMPFCLLSKKRYVGMLYEHDPNKGKRKEMGIVLKRRDNAPIVKEIYGGIIDILMKDQDIGKATDFLKACLRNIVEEKYPMEKLIITKSLRSGYKNPQQIAHKVLADRITSRDPGNKPGSGDRIPFVYIHHPNKKALQGEKIETPTFIKENNLKIDYSFYITNQIMKPVQQVFALVLEKIWTMNNKKAKIAKFKKEIETLRETIDDPEKFQDKLETMKNKEVKVLLFDEFLRETNNQKESNQAVTKFFGKKV